MNIEDEIAKRLMQGSTPGQLIGEGFKKSTVYKVHQQIKTYLTQTTKSEWKIINIYPSEPRALPNQTIPISFEFTNTADKDIYLYRVGISTEWMENDTWIAQSVRDLIRSGQRRHFSIPLPIPGDMPLGEYTLTFGVEMQYLPVNEYQTLQTQWTEPMVIHVKKPLRNLCVFLSHSTEDITLIRQLEKQLDNEGITVILGEDSRSPGTDLKEKFKKLIQSSNLFVALLTENSAKSEWVAFETNYANEIRKPMILLKEESVRFQSNVEWINFSKNDHPEVIFGKVMDAINRVKEGSPIGAILGLGLLALIVGALMSDKK